MYAVLSVHMRAALGVRDTQAHVHVSVHAFPQPLQSISLAEERQGEARADVSPTLGLGGGGGGGSGGASGSGGVAVPTLLINPPTSAAVAATLGVNQAAIAALAAGSLQHSHMGGP